jgi:hypothetical protein
MAREIAVPHSLMQEWYIDRKFEIFLQHIMYIVEITCHLQCDTM